MKISEKFIKIENWFRGKMKETRGDLATNTMGAIIIAVVIVGFLIAALGGFMPDFFEDILDTMSDEMNSNW